MMQRSSIIYRKPENDNWLDSFLYKVAPASVTPLHNDQTTRINRKHFLSRPFTMCELDAALKDTTNTAPGYDEIRYCMLVNLPSSAKKLLLQIFDCTYIYIIC